MNDNTSVTEQRAIDAVVAFTIGIEEAHRRLLETVLPLSDDATREVLVKKLSGACFKQADAALTSLREHVLKTKGN
jgi:hypothetical protein